MRKVFVSLIGMSLVSALEAAGPPPSGLKQIQCWTDDKGSRMCGDTVPPQYAKKEREFFNRQGIVVGKKSRELTPEEAAEEKRKADEAAAELKRIQEHAAYDKFLTDTYGSSKELEAARKLREQTLDGRIGLAQKAIADNEKALADLRGRVDKAGKKQPDKKLMDQIRKFEASLADNKTSVVQLQQDKEKMVAKFNKDIARYQELRPGN